MKKVCLGLITGLAVTTAVLVSCKKNVNEQNAPKTEGLKKMSARLGYYDLPKNENGMLVFRDQEQYDNYLSFLDKAVEPVDPKDTASDINTVLQDIENGLNFTSARKVSHDEYERNDARGWASLEAIPDEHFILSSDIRSTLNPELDVQIGDEILHYVSKDYAVRVDVGQEELLQQFKKLPADVPFDVLTRIDPARDYSSVAELTGLGGFFGKKQRKPTGDFIDPPYHQYPDACNRPGYIKFVNMACRLNGGSSVEAYFTINFGDGSPTTTVSSYGHYIDGNYFARDFYHQYPVPASGATVNYTMTITASYNNGNQTVSTTHNVPVKSTIDCAVYFKDSDWQYTAIPGTSRHIGGKLVMQNINTVNNSQLRVVAYSKLVEQNADGSFSGVKGELYVFLDCDVKNSNGCASWRHLMADGWDRYAKNQTLHRTMPNEDYNPDPAWSMAKSKHGYKSNGTWYWREITLYPCN